MTIVEMLGQSGVLTLLGMGIVFSFLIIMIICISLTGKLIHALGLDKETQMPAKPATQAAAGASNAAAITAAISAAVNEYRKTENR